MIRTLSFIPINHKSPLSMVIPVPPVNGNAGGNEESQNILVAWTTSPATKETLAHSPYCRAENSR